MADNTVLNAGSGGDTLATASVTFSGDTSKVQICGLGVVTGSAESYAMALVDTTNPFPTDIRGMVGQVDSTNSTTTPLGIGAAFTGTATEVLNFAHVMVNIFADEDSATDGLSIQWSSDGTNWDNTDVFTYTANTGKTYSFPAVARYYRVAYTNGATEQSVFRLEAILKVGSQASSSHRIADSISGQDDAELTKAVITGLAPNGSFTNVLVTTAGEMKVSIQDINSTIIPVSQSGTWNITNVSGTISLPTGASTAANQSTGNTALAAIQASVEIMDDWDESDRAKCNVIVGQAGIAAGTGVDAATVPRVTLATDIPLPAGANAIGKLAANSGVDIGDVDVTSIIPGVGAANLGKAEDSVHSSGDVGVMPLAVRVDVPTEHAPAGDYAPQTISEHGCINVDAQHYMTIDDADATTGWSVLGNDTTNLTTSTNHVWKTASLSFDKVNGAANTIFAGIQKTLSSTNLNGFIEEGGGFLLGSIFVTSVADIAYAWMRVGTDASNYNEWRVDDGAMVANQWNAMRGIMRAPFVSVGNGWDSSAVTYVAIGLAFDAEDDTLAEILVDGMFANSGLQTSSDITSQISTSVSSPNVKVNGWLGSVDTGAGNLSVGGTLRVVNATDDVNLAAIKTAVELADDVVATLGTATYSEATTKGNVIGAVRNDDLATLVNTDNEVAPLQVDAEGAVYVNLAASEPKRASGVAASGTTAIITAVAARKFRILAMTLTATSATATNVYLATTTDTDVWGNAGNPIPMAMDADGDNIAGVVWPYNPAGYTETSTVNEDLNLILSAAQDVVWTITWIEVP